jgi:UTP--glucose-1-phosphate uridylyltransferase
MKLRKAVITAAAPDQSKLPLQTIIDKDGIKKSVLEILVEEVVTTGITDICIVIEPSNEKTYGQVLGQYGHYVKFVYQEKSLGYGHALYCAKEYVGNEFFLHLVGDHLYINRNEISCAQHLVEFARKQDCSVSTVQATRESQIPNFGVVGGAGYQKLNSVYKINKVIEKPTPTIAEQELLVPGLRIGHYLCFFGMHVLSPTVFEILGNELEKNPRTKINLSFALNILAQTEQYLALEKNDLRYDMGDKYGLLKAQLALALNGKDRDQLLTELLELFVMKDISNIGR